MGFRVGVPVAHIMKPFLKKASNLAAFGYTVRNIGKQHAPVAGPRPCCLLDDDGVAIDAGKYLLAGVQARS